MICNLGNPMSLRQPVLLIARELFYLTYVHTHIHIHIKTHTHIHTRTHTLPLSRTHLFQIRTCDITYFRKSCSISHMYTHTSTHTQTHTLSRSHTLSLAHSHTHTHTHPSAWFICEILLIGCIASYGVPTIGRHLKIIGLFCKRALQKRLYSSNETYNFQEPTNRSHPICGPWLIHIFGILLDICAMTHSYVCHDLFVRVRWLIHTCAMTHSYVYHDSFMRVPWLIHTCTMTHSYLRHGPFIRVPWMIWICDITHIHMCVMTN